MSSKIKKETGSIACDIVDASLNECEHIACACVETCTVSVDGRIVYCKVGDTMMLRKDNPSLVFFKVI